MGVGGGSDVRHQQPQLGGASCHHVAKMGLHLMMYTRAMLSAFLSYHDLFHPNDCVKFDLGLLYILITRTAQKLPEVNS